MVLCLVAAGPAAGADGRDEVVVDVGQSGLLGLVDTAQSDGGTETQTGTDRRLVERESGQRVDAVVIALWAIAGVMTVLLGIFLWHTSPRRRMRLAAGPSAELFDDLADERADDSEPDGGSGSAGDSGSNGDPEPGGDRPGGDSVPVVDRSAARPADRPVAVPADGVEAAPGDGAKAARWDLVVVACRRVSVHSARFLHSVAARLGPTREQGSAPAGDASEHDSRSAPEEGPGDKAAGEQDGGERSV